LRQIDEAAHSLVYRQTVTHMEAMGRLYRDPRTIDEKMLLPFRSGQAVAIADPSKAGWVLAGLIDQAAGPGMIIVDFTDGSNRIVPAADLVLLESAVIPPAQLFEWVVPSALAVFVGLPDSGEAKLAWVADAVLWDVLLVLSLLGGVRARIPVREWLFPACVVLATVGALIAIPGSPGNAERHRATQTVPLLLVFASGLLSAVPRRGWASAGRPVTRASSMPPSESAAAASSIRSA
jgi:hypothetical protein